MINTLTEISNTVFTYLVSPPVKKFRWINIVFLIVLFVGGFYGWSKFLNWGRGGWDFHDWTAITLPRFTFLKDAMQQGVLPLHVSNTDALGGITSRFMAIPDQVLSPQIILLRYLDVGSFVVLQVGLMYALGFIGLLRFRKKFGLSVLAFTTIFLLYNFNGYIVAHLSAGHLTWAASFLFIWFVLLIYELIEGKTGWHWVTMFSILLFGILLQGGYHQFVWCIFFMLLLVIFSIKNFAQIALGIIFSILISMVRLLPPFILLGKFSNIFIGGYREALTILNDLIYFQTADSPIGAGEISGGLRPWEATVYIGIIGAVFLLYFGIWRAARNVNGAHNNRVLLLPALCIAFLSLDRVYQILRNLLPLPLFTGERVSSRMIGLAFAVILALAVIEFQAWLNHSKPSKFLLSMICLLLLFEVNDLWNNYALWSIPSVASRFIAQGYTPTQWRVANDWHDTPYLVLILIGFIISVLSLAFLIYMSWREKRFQNVAQANPNPNHESPTHNEP